MFSKINADQSKKVLVLKIQIDWPIIYQVKNLYMFQLALSELNV